MAEGIINTDDLNRLFFKSLTISWRVDNATERECTVQLFVGLQFKRQKEIVIRLTSENDLSLLYTLKINQEDFQRLKDEQHLLIDFDSFPNQLIELLDDCICDNKDSSPKFVLGLKSSSLPKSHATLEVVERNIFKSLIHLSLTLVPGKDADVKNYLASCLNTVKDEKCALLKNLHDTEEDLKLKLSIASGMLEARTQELEQARTQWSLQIEELMQQKTNEIVERDRHLLKLQTTYEDKISRRHTEAQQTHRQMERNMKNEKHSLQAKLKDQSAKLSDAISTVKSQNSQIIVLEKENKEMKSEIQVMCEHERLKHGEESNKNRTLQYLQAKMDDMLKIIEEKDKVIENSTEALRLANMEKINFEKELHIKIRNMSKLQASLDSMSHEISKGNNIIQRLQNELKHCNSQIKSKNSITAKQEKVINDQEENILKQDKNTENLKEELTNANAEKDKLTQSCTTLSEKLDEMKELIKTNENVINWLSKQLNGISPGGNTEGKLHLTDGSSLHLSSRQDQLRKLGPMQSTPNSITQSVAMGPNKHILSKDFSYPIPRHYQQQVMYRPPLRHDTNKVSNLKVTSTPADTVQPQVPRKIFNAMEKEKPLLDAKYLKEKENIETIVETEDLTAVCTKPFIL